MCCSTVKLIGITCTLGGQWKHRILSSVRVEDDSWHKEQAEHVIQTTENEVKRREAKQQVEVGVKLKLKLKLAYVEHAGVWVEGDMDLVLEVGRRGDHHRWPPILLLLLLLRGPLFRFGFLALGLLCGWRRVGGRTGAGAQELRLRRPPVRGARGGG